MVIVFSSAGRPYCRGPRNVAVNNHVDVDGILSVYVLVHSYHALAHRQTIIEAADMGDFWGWGEPPAQRVFQGITHLMQQGGDAQMIYTEAFRRIPGLIDGSDPEVSVIEEPLSLCVSKSSLSNRAKSLAGNTTLGSPTMSFRYRSPVTMIGQRMCPCSMKRSRQQCRSGRKFVLDGMPNEFVLFRRSGIPVGYTTFGFPATSGPTRKASGSCRE
jgi:hypothetical protein